jgi:PAS domain S-box-containing protein
MKCPKCRFENIEGAKFCNECGVKLETIDSHHGKAEQEDRPNPTAQVTRDHPPGAIEPLLRHEQVALAYRLGPPSVIISLLPIVFVWWVIHPVYPGLRSNGWLALSLVFVAVRLIIASLYKRRKVVPHDAGFWGLLFSLCSVAVGLLWGYAGVALFPIGQPHLQVLLLITITGLAAGTLPFVMPLRWTYAAYIIPMMVPFAAYLIYLGSIEQIFIGVLTFCFIGFMLFCSEGIGRTIVENVSSRLRQTYMAEEIEKANRQLRDEITERTKAEEALKESEERYRSVFENSLDAVLLTSPDGTTHAANPEACRIFGMTEEEIIRAGREGVVDVSDPRLEAALEERDRTGRFRAEFNLRRKDGTVFPAEVSSAVYQDRSGPKTSIIVRDVTERTRAEEALRESEANYRAFFQNAAMGTMQIGMDKRFLQVNDRFCQMTGYSREELLQMTPVDVTHPDDREAESDHWLAYTTGRNEVYNTEKRYVTKNGRVIWAQATGALIRDADGKPLRTAGVIHDITDRKRAEEELQKIRDGLEVRVQERTRELGEAYEKLVEETARKEAAEAQLRQAQKMEAVGTLAGGIAHDFNNMLAVILGNAELALDELNDGEGARGNIEEIIATSKRARALTRQILTFSKRTERERDPLRLKPLLEETYKMLRDIIPTTIRMELAVRTESDTILGDPVQVQQILINLATNAAYAMRTKGGLITFSLTDVTLTQEGQIPGAELPPGTYVKLSVQDTGTGMPEKVRSRVFEPFFTTKGPDKGTGMGLAVVYGIVKNHDGDITVESTPGEGSTFDVFLPLSEGKARRERRESKAPGGNERMLLVDDDLGVLKMISQTLTGLGYKVTAAPGGKDAWDIFRGNPDGFDCIVTDQIMPDLTGMDLAEKVLQVRQHMPIVLLTGYSETVGQEQAKAAGIIEFVMKPAAKQELAKSIRRAIDKKKQS